MSNESRAQVILDGDNAPLRQVLRESVSDLKNFGEKAGSHIGSVTSAGIGLKTALVGVAATLAGSSMVTSFRHVQDLKDELSKAAQKAGTTTENFSEMAYAAKLADLSNQDLIKSYAKLGSLLTDAQQGQKEAVETFRRLKLDPKNIKDSDALLMELADRFGQMENGAKKVALAVDIFGEKLGPKLIPFLNAGRQGLADLRKEAQQLGVVVSTEAGRDAERFNDSLTTMNTAIRGASMQIGKTLIPELTEAAEFFTKVAKESGIWEATLISIGRLLAKGLGVDDVGKATTRYENLKAIAAQAHKNLGDMYREAAANPHATTAQGVIEKLTAKVKLLDEEVLKAGAAIGQLGSKNGLAGGGRGFVNPQGFPSVPFDPEAKTPNGPKTPEPASSYMAYYELMLAEEKHAQSVIDSGQEYRKEQELAFWRFLLQNLQLTSADRVAVLRKIAKAEVAITKKSTTERKALEVELADQAEAQALGKLDAERAVAKMMLDLGQLKNAQFLQLDANLEQQRFEIQRAALEARMLLLKDDPSSTPAERERVNGKLLELDRQYQARRIEIMTGLSKTGALANVWDGLNSSFTSAMDGMLFHAQTWGQALASIYRSVGSAFVREVATEPIAKWMVMQAKMLAAKLGFVAQENAIGAAGSAATVATKAAETSAVVGANAVQAGTGAAASQAPIPIIGPVLALAAMAAIFAAVSGFGKSNKSAANGYDIPAGINPMVQTHEEEMILPKQISNGFRQLFAEGGVGQGRGDTNHYSINALDARSFYDFLQDNSDAVAAAHRKARRDNNG